MKGSASSLKSHLPELRDASDRAPIELHAAADAVNARADHHDVLVVEAQVVLRAVIGQVQVVGAGGPLSRHRIDLLDYRQDGPIATQLSHRQLSAEGGKQLRIINRKSRRTKKQVIADKTSENIINFVNLVYKCTIYDAKFMLLST